MLESGKMRESMKGIGEEKWEKQRKKREFDL